MNSFKGHLVHKDAHLPERRPRSAFAAPETGEAKNIFISFL